MKRTIAAATLRVSWQPTDGDGAPADPAGTVTVSITRADGTALVADDATGGAGSAARTYELAAADNRIVDLLTVDWSVDGTVMSTETVEVVGGLLFTRDELLGREASTGTSQHSDADIAAVRVEVERAFERWVGGSFFPAFRLERVRSDGGIAVLSRCPVRAVRSITRYYDTSTDTLAATADELALIQPTSTHLLQVPVGLGSSSSLLVGFEHGLDGPDGQVKRQAARYGRLLLDKGLTSVPDRASSFVDAAGTTIFLARPGVRDSITGIDELDEMLRYYRDSVFAGWAT